MADQGSPGQSAPVAAPAPARDRREPGHGITEAQFWADDGAPAIGGQYGIPNGLIAAAAAAPPNTPDDVASLLGRLDGRRARGLALQFQRTSGNRQFAVQMLQRPPAVHRNGDGVVPIQRQGPHPPAAPAPGGSPAPGANATGYAYRGIDVSKDKNAMRTQFEGLVERGGLADLESWHAAFFSVGLRDKKMMAVGVSEDDVEAIDEAAGDTIRELQTDARSFLDTLKPDATTAATEILDGSKERIEKELDKYGIKEEEIPPPGGGGAEGAPAAYDKKVTMENVGAAQNAQAKAKDLAKSRREADKAQKSFMALATVPDMPQVSKAIEKSAPEIETPYKRAEDAWKMLEDIFARMAMASTAEFPVLAMYASGPDAANQLDSFASQPPEQLGETIWREARTRLENIETVREGLGARFDPLSNDRIVQLVLSRETVKAWQKRIGRDDISAIKEKAEQKQMFWATIAIGLGLIAALPTGGASVAAAGIVTAAAVAGAALSVYNAYDHWRDYQMKTASSRTDFAKAQSISQEEPSFFWLAVDIVGAGLEIGAAASAFKSLVKVVKEARATRNILKMAEAVDAVAPAKAASKIKATVAGELGPDAAGEMIVAEGAKFRSGDLAKVRQAFEKSATDVWAEAYDALASQGKIRPMTEETIHEVFGHLPARDPTKFANRALENIADGDLATSGIYYSDVDMILVKPGEQHHVATIVAHELTHAGQPQNIGNFWAEFEAYSAQRRLMREFDRLGVGMHVPDGVQWLHSASDLDIATHIKAAHGWELPPGVKFGAKDEQTARASIEAVKRALAVANR